MTARKLLLHVYGWLVAEHGEDAVYDILHPPTPEERLQDRLAELRAAGIAVNA